jgi:hypothetical protein
MSMSNREIFPVTTVAPAFIEFLESTKRMNEYAQGLKDAAQKFLDSPSMKATEALASRFQEQTKSMRKLMGNPRFRLEMQIFRKKNKGTELAEFLERIIREVSFTISRIFIVNIVRIKDESKSGRERMMALRGLALSCAPNTERVSDIYLSMVASRRFA